MTSATRGAIPLLHPIKSAQMVVDSTEKNIQKDIPGEKSFFSNILTKCSSPFPSRREILDPSGLCCDYSVSQNKYISGNCFFRQRNAVPSSNEGEVTG